VTQNHRQRIISWLWTAAIVVFGTVAGLLVVSDRRTEPSEAYRFDIAKYQRVDSAQALYAETATWSPGLAHVSAVVAGPEDRIYVTGEKELVVYQADGTEIRRKPLTDTPNCVALLPNGDILLGMRDHVEEIDAEGTVKSTWETLGEKAHITSIAADEKNVYVADAGQRRVFCFDHGGKLIGRIGGKDEQRGIPGFVVPSPYFDVALDPQGALWAVNPGKHGLESYRPNGDLITSWYRPSMELKGFCGCCNPIHIAFRSDGSLVTAEKGISRIKLYSPDQVFIGLVAGPDAFGERPEAGMSIDMETPIKDLTVDSKDRILVLDGRQGRVRIFEEIKEKS